MFYAHTVLFLFVGADSGLQADIRSFSKNRQNFIVIKTKSSLNGKWIVFNCRTEVQFFLYLQPLEFDMSWMTESLNQQINETLDKYVLSLCSSVL